jgi:hypothetical protein
MAQNEFTKSNHDVGATSQAILNAGLNVFALDLIVESFTQLAGKSTEKIEFTYKGVKIQLQISGNAK